MDYTEKAREIFAKDVFATGVTGIVIDKAAVDFAECSLEIKPCHLNAAGTVMGGVIFTLADFAFAVAANTGNPLTVSLSSSINFISGASCSVLRAKAECIKNTRNVCFYTVTVSDGDGKMIASVSTTGFRKQ